MHLKKFIAVFASLVLLTTTVFAVSNISWRTVDDTDLPTAIPHVIKKKTPKKISSSLVKESDLVLTTDRAKFKKGELARLTKITSGARLQTAHEAISLRVGELGSIYLDPDTIVKLKFDDKHLEVVTLSGHATLFTSPGIESSSTSSEEAIIEPDPAVKPTTTGGKTSTGNTNKDDFDDKPAVVITAIVVTTITALELNSNKNPSPSAP